MSTACCLRTTLIRAALALGPALLLAACGSPEKRAQNYYENGMRLLAAQNNEKAAIEFRNALSLKKDLLPAWRGLAQVDRNTNRWDDLAAVLQAILHLAPHDGAARVEFAKILLASGVLDQALKVINEAPDEDSRDADLLATKALIFLRIKDTNAAVGAARAAVDIDPGNVDAVKVLAADRLANNDPNAALKLLSASSLEQKTDLGVQFLKIKIFEALNNGTEVEASLKSLTEQYPGESAFRRQLIKFYIDGRRQDAAEAELRRITNANPNDSAAEIDLIRLLYTTKGPAVARAEILTRVNAGGDVFPYKVALAELDFEQGNRTDSYDLLKSLASDQSSPEHALTAKLRLAELNLKAGNLDAAEAAVSEILGDESLSALKLHVSALTLRASIKIARGQFDAAIFDLRLALESKPHSAELMVLLATAYERSGAVELAAKEFADAFKASDSDASVGLDYVGFLERRGNIQQADEVLTDLAGRRPDDVRVLAALAEVKLARQDWAGAQEISNTIRRVSGNGGVADEILGEALSGEHKFDQSMAAFRDALAAAPSTGQPMVSMVRALMRAQQTDRAESFLQEVLKSDPANAEAYVLLGTIQLSKNVPDQAMKSFMAAIEKQPKESIGYRGLANLYLRQKNNSAALMVVQAGLKQKPDSADLHMTLAGILEQTGNYEAAIGEYEYLLKLQPGSMVVANNLASLLADHRTDKASLDRAQSLATELKQTHIPQFNDTLGWVSYRRGDFKAAIPMLEQAAAALPDIALIRYHLGMAYAANSQAGKASAELKSAQSKANDSALQRTIEAELAKISTQ